MARKHLLRPVESCQAQQATQVDAGLHRLAVELKVELACLESQGIKLVFQCGAPRAPAQRKSRKAVLRQYDQLPSLIATDMLGHHLAFVQHAEFVTAGANRHGPARQPRRRRVAVAVKLDPRMGTDNRQHELVGVEGGRRQWTQHRSLPLETVHRAFSGRLVHPDVGHLVAPEASQSPVVLKADQLLGASGQGVVLNVAHAPLDDPF